MGEGEGGRRLREPLARRGVDPSTSSGSRETRDRTIPPPLCPLPPKGGEILGRGRRGSCRGNS